MSSSSGGGLGDSPSWDRPAKMAPSTARDHDMVGHVLHRFCDEAAYNPRFRLAQSNDYDPAAAGWKVQYWDQQRLDPEPSDFKAIWESHPDVNYQRLPDLLTVGSLPVVCEAFRQIVLDLEPNKHQFVPITLYDEAKQALPGAYWVMNVLQRCDCVIDKAQLKKWEAEGHVFPEVEQLHRTYRPTSRAIKPYLNKTRTAGLHLWRPMRSPYWFEFFVSDELMRRVNRANLRKLNARPAVEISVPSLL
jgi:hypothetical protein